jgi:hypothetical protein
MKNVKAIALLSFLFLSTGLLFSQTRSKINPEGTWAFTAPEAPYEYSTGDFVITREGQELKGEFVFSEYYKVPVQDLKLENDSLTFRAYVEGTSIYSKNKISNDEITGTVSTPEGLIGFTAKRKQE